MVLPVPHMGSRTQSWGCVKNSMHSRASVSGKGAGWARLSASRAGEGWVNQLLFHRTHWDAGSSFRVGFMVRGGCVRRLSARFEVIKAGQVAGDWVRFGLVEQFASHGDGEGIWVLAG